MKCSLHSTYAKVKRENSLDIANSIKIVADSLLLHPINNSSTSLLCHWHCYTLSQWRGSNRWLRLQKALSSKSKRHQNSLHFRDFLPYCFLFFLLSFISHGCNIRIWIRILAQSRNCFEVKQLKHNVKLICCHCEWSLEGHGVAFKNFPLKHLCSSL